MSCPARSCPLAVKVWSLRHVTSRRVVSCHVISCHLVSYRCASSHVMLCHLASCRVASPRVMSRHVMSCHVISCYVASRCVASCYYVMSRRVALHRVASCRVVSSDAGEGSGRSTSYERTAQSCTQHERSPPNITRSPPILSNAFCCECTFCAGKNAIGVLTNTPKVGWEMFHGNVIGSGPSPTSAQAGHVRTKSGFPHTPP